MATLLLLMFLPTVVGFVIGFATRSYMSHVRRERLLATRPASLH